MAVNNYRFYDASVTDSSKKLYGDGVSIKAKLIGVDELAVEKDEKVCLDSMFKLKAIARAKGKAKQRIQLNFTIAAVKLIDEVTKVPIATHEVERIRFVVVDPRDSHAFGYTYNTSDETHQFWAIKTERPAAAAVLIMEELFEIAIEQYAISQDASVLKSAITSTPDPSSQFERRKELQDKLKEAKKIHAPAMLKSHYSEGDTVKIPGGFSGCSTGPSSFDLACRDTNISLVENYLQTMSLEEVNKMEPNGSTALHAAAYEGHEKIVDPLLKEGACHLIHNKHNFTSLDEAKNDNISQLIRRRTNNSRFTSESVEWTITTDYADYQSHEYFKKLEAYGKDPHFYQLIIYIKENYLDKDLQHVKCINTIKRYFDLAIQQKDPVYLLKAYTAETGFYSKLNVQLAQLKLENLTSEENLSRAYYIGLIARHPNFERLSHIGVTYRGMMITDDDIQQYKIGTRILTKTFSSSSKQLNVALRFLKKNRDTENRLSTICIYEIRNQRTALDIEHISLYPDEKEVLILPYSAFKIIDIKQDKHKLPQVEIKLKECEPW